jgi:hypothetical protein
MRAKRATKEELEERMNKIFELKEKGISKSEILKILSLTEPQFQNTMNKYRKNNRNCCQCHKPKEVYRKSWSDYCSECSKVNKHESYLRNKVSHNQKRRERYASQKEELNQLIENRLAGQGWRGFYDPVPFEAFADD